MPKVKLSDYRLQITVGLLLLLTFSLPFNQPVYAASSCPNTISSSMRPGVTVDDPNKCPSDSCYHQVQLDPSTGLFGYECYHIDSSGNAVSDTSNFAPSSGCKPGSLGCSSSAGISCDPDHFSKDSNGVPNPGPGIWTAIGCVPTDPQALVKRALQFIIDASGGIALLMMAFSAIGMITSQGNPEALKNAQGRFTAAVVGLLFIIFSVFLLKVIGVDILAIPGFSP